MSAKRRATSPNLFFLRQFLRQPKMVGSIIPTSQPAIKAMLDGVDWRHVRCVVEYGPGTGVFTRAILRRLGPTARLVAIDTNPTFAHYLSASIADDRLISVEGSAADIEAILTQEGLPPPDFVISGLPFSTLPRAVAEMIMDATARALQPGGTFLIYQYSLFVLPFLRTRFDHVDIGRIWRCVPPARLFWATKSKSAVSSVADESLAAA